MMFFVGFGVLTAFAQTITPNESEVLLASPKKVGINLNGPSYFGAGELYKNYLWRNPGFEPDLYRDKFVAYAAGTTTTFTAPSSYDPVVANFWAGASFWLYRGSPKALVCSGNIASNTTATSSTGPTYTFASACSTAVAEGDVLVLRLAVSCTPEADWEAQHGGWWTSVSGGGKIVSDCSTPYDGVQAMQLNASTSGATASAIGHIDTANWVVGVLFNGEYTISGYYKTTGSPTFTVSAQRNTTGTTGSPLSCAAKTFPASSTWTSFSMTCTGSETASLPQSDVTVTFTAQGGVVELDDVSFEKSSGLNAANTSVFRDEVVAALEAHCAGASLTGVPCELRDWAGQNADEIANTVKPLFQRRIQVNSFNYDYAGGQGYPSEAVGLEEFLQLCEVIGAEPYYALPETTNPEEAANWIEYLNGSASTTYGALRAAHGQSQSWLSVFPTVHLAMGNENWNESQSGQGLGYRSDAPDLYYDYSSDAAGVWGAMRSSASWPSGGTGVDLVLGFQDGNAGYGVSEAMTRTSATSGELAPYTQFYVGDTTPLLSLWTPLMYEVVANVSNSASVFYQQGSSIKTYGKLNVYEFDNGTTDGGTGLTQAVADTFTDAAGYGTATALQVLEHLSYGIVDQNFFSLSEYYNTIPNGVKIHSWGAFIDIGGITNAIRPQELGMRMVNAAIIGPMYSCPVTNPTTYNLAANHNGMSSSGTPAANNIPYEYAFCFMSGDKRSMVVINTDVYASHDVTFAGTSAPTGSVTVTRYAPSSISATNEATGTNYNDGSLQNNVAINASYVTTSPTTDTLPPYSVTRYDWSTDGTATSPSTDPATATPAATTTKLTSSSSQVTTGGSVTLTATVSSTGATGTVSFSDNGSVIGSASVSSGSASFAAQGLTTGSHAYTATYSGDTAYSASTSNSVTVTAIVASTSYLHTTFNEYAAGHSLNGTAPATGPAGVTWTDSNNDWSFASSGGVVSATPDLSYPATISTGSADYTATIHATTNRAKILLRYVDSNNYLFAESFASEIDLYARVAGVESTLATIYPTDTSATLTVTLNGTTGSIACGGQTASATIPSTLTASAVIGLMPLASGFTYSSLDFAPISSTNTNSTTTSLAVSNSNPAASSSLVLTASVSPTSVSGSVTFTDGSTTLGTAAITSGVATYTIASLSAGSHSFKAAYSGGGAYSASTSSTVSLVAKATTSVTISASTTSLTEGSSVVLTAAVNPSAATGTVTFEDGTSALGSVAISNGVASYTVSSVAAGSHNYNVVYGGDSTYASSSSTSVAVTALARTTLTLAVSQNTVETGSTVTLTATLSAAAATGTVSFVDSGTALATVALSSGVASYTISSITVGSHSIVAVYSGDATYAASTASGLTITAATSSSNSSLYLATSFNEFSAGTALNRTAPVTAPQGVVWSDPNGDWSFVAGGGVQSATPDLTNPTLIDVGHADYLATWTFSGYGAKVLFRYVDADNYLFAQSFETEIDVYARVAGVETKLATIYPYRTADPLLVSVYGSVVTVRCDWSRASATIPSSLLTQTKIGVFPLSAGFQMKSLSVTP